MAKRQLRIHELAKIPDKKSLIGELSTFCMVDKRVIFGTITNFKDETFTLEDKLRKTHIFPIQKISEIIVEKSEIAQAESI